MDRRLIVVANRLPLRTEGNSWEKSPGGLVTALTPVVRARHGAWLGWSGAVGIEHSPFDVDGMRIVPVDLDRVEVEDYYRGFCNRTIWPLLHDAVRTPEYERHWWDSYMKVNRRFADEALRESDESDLVWVHDYHLLLVPGMLRARNPRMDIRFFLHIPFPPVELFARLPWRRQVLQGMLGADVIGFQTQRSATNFIASASLFTDAELSGDGLVIDGRKLEVVAAPISIETSEFARIAAAPQTEDRIIELRRELGDPKHIILGADRMDYTKGIDVRLRAFGELLTKQPELAETVKFVQIAVPSRESIDDYEQMRRNIDQLAGRINSGYGHHMPVHYVYESLDRPDLIAYYRAADVMAVTPFADGMNLVAKEYVASRINGDGALVLSEFAGAARELRSALLVNPYDVDGVAEGLARALTLDEGERRQRMSVMRRTVADNDLEMWVERAMRDDRTASDGGRGLGAIMRRWLGPRAEVSRGA